MRVDERSGGNAQDGAERDAVGTGTEITDSSNRVVNLCLLSLTTQNKSSVFRCCSADVCHFERWLSAETYYLIQRDQKALA